MKFDLVRGNMLSREVGFPPHKTLNFIFRRLQSRNGGSKYTTITKVSKKMFSKKFKKKRKKKKTLFQTLELTKFNKLQC